MAFRKDYNEPSDLENPTSRINAAGMINQTLEKLWGECYTAMSNGDFVKWNTKLDSIWAILGGDEEEGNGKDKQFNEINLKIYQTGSLKNKLGSGFSQKENPNNPLQYHLLLKKSLFLRRLQNKQGKGTAYKNSDLDDFD
jgi:hypothetical protein